MSNQPLIENPPANVESVETTAEGVPKTNLKERLGKIIGEAKGHIKANYKQALQVLLDKMKAVILQTATGAISEKVSSSMCERMDSINSLQNRLNEFAQQVAQTATKMLETAERLLGPIAKLLNIISVILNIPLPASVPPGIGIPVSIINGLNDIKGKIGKIVEIIRQIVNAIRALVAGLQAALEPAMDILSKINDIVGFAQGYCEILLGLGPDPDPDLLELLDEAENSLSDALGLIQSELDGNGSDGYDDVLSDLVDTFTDLDAEDLIPEGIKSRLRRRAILGDFDDGSNSDVDGGDGSDQGLGPDGLPLGSGANTGITGLPPNSELFTAVDGNVYLLSVKDDPRSPLVAKRREGTAQLWNDGDPSAVVLKSPQTFTTSSRIILDDIKIRLNTQLTLL